MKTQSKPDLAAAKRPCPHCDGGTQFDMGGGWEPVFNGFTQKRKNLYVIWRCYGGCETQDKEFVSQARMTLIRSGQYKHGAGRYGRPMGKKDRRFKANR